MIGMHLYTMVSVIIPVLNEEKTIAKVVRFARQNPHVSEVIVVDDQSSDNSVNEAKAAGAKIVISKQRGKGISLREGIDEANNEILVFLDGDIHPYPSNTIASMVDPIIHDDCDFVKANFSRNAGRVTELVAKPLLTILFPELAKFSQPLGGMVAGRKQFLNRIEFLPDYGVDVGLLIDMCHVGARIQEVRIGYIQNKSKPWRSLVNMSKEVSGAILHKAFQYDIALGQLLTKKENGYEGL